MLAMLWVAMCWGWGLAKDLPYTSISLLSNYPKTFTTIAVVRHERGSREAHTQHLAEGQSSPAPYS